MDFIEIQRIIRDKDGNQKGMPEVICVSDIHSFRPWHPGPNDTFTEKATMLVMKASSRVSGQKAEKHDDKGGDKKEDDKGTENLPTMLILEDFTNFIKRMSGRVIVIGNAR